MKPISERSLSANSPEAGQILPGAVADLTRGLGASDSIFAARASERGLCSILDKIPDAVSVKGSDQRYRLVNRAFEQRFGLQPGWIVGRTDEEALPPGLVAEAGEGDEWVLRTGEVVERESLVEQEGENRTYLTVKFALRDDNDDVCGVCAVFNDITESRRRETERTERLTWTDRISAAVEQDRLVLHGQPIVNLACGEVEQAELLVRMVGDEGSSALIPPCEFLPPAERFNLIAMIDLWVVAQALELAVDHRVEINLSGKTISDGEHVAAIERLVADSEAPPTNIIFEITETAVVENLGAVRLFADRLRARGCSFALDDFGVGFGTFTYLKHLSVDYLKIDVEFVRELLSNDTDRHVVHAMVAVARGFGIKTIAEGVEDEATLELLASMGVDYAQGFWLGRPAPVDELWPRVSHTERTA